MKRIVVILVLLGMIFAESCSPVRSGGANKRKISGRGRTAPDIPKEAHSKSVRFGDTTVIELPAVYSGSGSSLAYDFDKAIMEFDNSKFDDACEKIRFFAGTFPEGDSLYYESMFYLSECEIVDNNIHKSKELLHNLLEDPATPATIQEKVLIRLGQVYCVLGDEIKAKEYFQRLIANYPSSIYISIANCESIK